MPSQLFIRIAAIFLAAGPIAVSACSQESGTTEYESVQKMDVIFDTDANNEIDDQHALAYLLFSGDYFNVEGVTVNATSAPGPGMPRDIQAHYDEARRVMQLCGEFYGKIPLLAGADGSFEEIREFVHEDQFDGYEAVNFIIEEAMKERNGELFLLPVGKLTNIALALKKEPAIAGRVRIVWLGSNYPETGEHNKVWDPESMNYILDTEVPFEMVTVRYGQPSGTTAVRVTQAQISHRMPGVGPVIPEPVTGRHGGQFNNWGDYSVNLFEMYRMSGDPPSRPLFDMAAVAILKNPNWAERKRMPAPIMDIDGDQWIDRPDNPREIVLWEWFDIYGIMNDFFVTMKNPVLVEKND